MHKVPNLGRAKRYGRLSDEYQSAAGLWAAYSLGAACTALAHFGDGFFLHAAAFSTVTAVCFRKFAEKRTMGQMYEAAFVAWSTPYD